MNGEGGPGSESGTDAVSVAEEAFGPLAGRRLLDVGCGAGGFVRSLAARGARVVGVDPNPEALVAAREAVPGGTFQTARAEALPFADASFDGAVFLNSLHHVPKADMHDALREAARVVGAAGRIVVVEPLAEGSFFLALRPVEDETEVRDAAQEVLRRAVESGEFEQIRRIDYPRRELFDDADGFLRHAVAVDPARAARVAGSRPEVEAVFRRHAGTTPDGRVALDQPMRAHVLRAHLGTSRADNGSR